MLKRKKSQFEQDFIDMIYKLADIFKLNNIEYNVVTGTDDVDTFSCSVYKVQIKGYRDGHRIIKNVAVKWNSDRETRTYFRESYRREYVFYRYIVPKILEMQKLYGIIEGLKIKFPNCILTSMDLNKEMIAIFGLTESGFRFRDRFHETNLEHASLVLKYLAKLHALSFVMAKTIPREFEEIKNLCHKDVQYSDPSRVSKSLKCYYDASVNVISDPVCKEKLKALGEDILSVLSKCTAPVPTYSCFCHGDCWNNNIMFQYKGGRPVDVILIDYQLARYSSPVTDISYFLYMSTDREFLKKHYNQALEIYYGTLSAVLRQCNLDVDEIYPRHVFNTQLKEYSVFGLIEALISMLIITSPCEEACKMTETVFQSTGDENLEEQNEYSTLFTYRINSVVEHFFERNYLLYVNK